MKLPNDQIIHYESKDSISIDITRTELVHCSECKHRTYCYSEVHMTNKRQSVDTHKDIDYCSYGERIEQEDE